jgi:hypothetical protein
MPFGLISTVKLSRGAYPPATASRRSRVIIANYQWLRKIDLTET